MRLDLKEGGTRPKVGVGYGADVDGKWCTYLETLKGAYRGNHIHSVDQFTVLLGGSAMVVKKIGSEIVEYPLHENVVHITPKGVPHVLIALENSILYEWWQEPYEAEDCPGVFDEYTKGLVGPRD